MIPRFPRASALLLFACLAASGRPFTVWAGAQPEQERTEFVLGTVCSVKLFDKGTAERYAALFGRLRELETIFSANRGDSELAALNRRAGTGPAAVSPELLAAADAACRFASLSGGAFDPSIGPLVKLWGIGGDAPAVPAEPEIAGALARTGWRDITVDSAAGTVTLARPGMELDLGAIAKGYAADELVRMCRGMGVTRAIIDLGGNIYALGCREGTPGSPGAAPWRIGVQDPEADRGGYLGIVTAADKAVVTSGVYERFFEEDGRRYHHILASSGPGAGRPVDNGLLSVTIAAASAMDADALSTACFVLGAEKALALLASFPGTAAVFVHADYAVTLSPGAEKIFTLTDDTYQVRDTLANR